MYNSLGKQQFPSLYSYAVLVAQFLHFFKIFASSSWFSFLIRDFHTVLLSLLIRHFNFRRGKGRALSSQANVWTAKKVLSWGFPCSGPQILLFSPVSSTTQKSWSLRNQWQNERQVQKKCEIFESFQKYIIWIDKHYEVHWITSNSKLNTTLFSLFSKRRVLVYDPNDSTFIS